MSTLYIYSIETNEHVATITGSSNDDCEIVANERYGSNDYAWTYSPAFGSADGLRYIGDAVEIKAN
jgi:hypothetical protein